MLNWPSRGLDAVVVGAGLMGRWHAHEIRRAGGRVVAVVDPEVGRARALADRTGGDVLALSDLAELPSRGGVVHVCTPSGSHEALVEAALQHGRHVLVEKPLATDASRTERLVAVAQERGLLLAAVHQFFFQRGIQRLHRDLERFGPLLHLVGEARSAGAEGSDDSEKDRVAIEILPHFLSLTRRFVPETFADLEWRATRTIPGEILIGAEAGSGTSVRVTVSMSGRPPTNRWSVIGRESTGHADLFHGHALIEPGDTSRTWKVARPFALGTMGLIGAAGNLVGRTARRQPAYPGLRELICVFYDAIRSGDESPVSPMEIIAVAQALDTIKRLVETA